MKKVLIFSEGHVGGLDKHPRGALKFLQPYFG